MSNNLNEDITNRYVIVKEETFKAEYRDLKWRVFHARGGFGCQPYTAGSAVFGSCVHDGEEFRIEGYHIERFATDDEVALAQKED